MRLISKIPFMLLPAASFCCSCLDENEEARNPQSVVTVNRTELEINQSMEIRFNGVADQVVVYTGDEGHDYLLRDSNNTGTVMNKGLFTYSYSVPGTFLVVVLATTYDTYMGNGLHTDTTSFNVTVKDDVTELEQVYSSITPNVYYASLVNETDWVMCLPKKQVYNGREVTLNASRQRLSFEIASDSSKIYFDGELHDPRAYYDLTGTHDIRVVSDFGSVRDYKFHTLVYPEFNTVSLDGATGTLVRDAFYQDRLVYRFTLPEGTSNPVVQFEIDGTGVFLSGGKAVESGERISLDDDLSIRRENAENAAVAAVSTVEFEITRE